MASPEPPRMAVRGLAFAYGQRGVLDGVDLELRAGELLGLLGPNGSGKSTVVKILSGVLAGYRGHARLDGREIRDVPQRELARSVAVVPQESVFGFPFTALEIVLLGRHPHLGGLAFESDEDLRIAHEALAACGARELAHRPIQQLSSGERQRVIFAKALAQRPRVLLLDEPASFLDIRHQVELYDRARGLVEEHGAAVLTVVHDLNLAAEYCDRVCLLHEGRVAAVGPTAEVLTYAHLKRVFATEVYVDQHEITGKLVVLPLSERARRSLSEEGST